MKLRYVGHGEIVVPPYGPWQPEQEREVGDVVGAGLIRRSDFVVVEEPLAVAEPEAPPAEDASMPRRKRGGS